MPPSTADAARGQQVYATYCARCHGAAGQPGKSKAGSITEPAFLALVSDQMLRTVVIAGRPDIGQPDWRNDMPGHPMSDQEVTDVVGWLSSQRRRTQKSRRRIAMSDDKAVSRRWLLMGIGVLLNGAVALLIATPIVGYLLGPIRKKGGYNSWIDLGDACSISRGRDAAGQLCESSRACLGMARPPRRPAGYAARRSRSSRFLPSTAPTWVARCAGFRSRNCLCAPAMAASITPMARAPRDRRREVFSNTPTKCKTAS